MWDFHRCQLGCYLLIKINWIESHLNLYRAVQWKHLFTLTLKCYQWPSPPSTQFILWIVTVKTNYLIILTEQTHYLIPNPTHMHTLTHTLAHSHPNPRPSPTSEIANPSKLSKQVSVCPALINTIDSCHRSRPQALLSVQLRLRQLITEWWWTLSGRARFPIPSSISS